MLRLDRADWVTVEPMGLRNFFRLLVRGVPPERANRHSGHDLADTVRDATGRFGAGGRGGGGRPPGNAVYEHIGKTASAQRKAALPTQKP